MFDWLVGKATNKEKVMRLHFRDNRHFKFEKTEVEDSILQEKKNGRLVRAWEMLYKLQLPFRGFKGIVQDMVTLTFERDVIFDPFNTLADTETPKAYISKLSREKGIGAWVSDITRTQQYKKQEESSKHMAATTQIVLLAIPTVLMAIGTLIVVLVNLKG